MTWQSDRARDFKRRTEGKLAAHWEEIRRNLAPPVVAWIWGESGLSQHLKCYLKETGLIERSPDGSKWMTSMDLWCYAISKAGDDEVVGADARGQQLLSDARTGTSRATRYLGEKTRGRVRQATLNGDTVDPRQSLNWRGVRENQMKDPTRATMKAERAAKCPGQMTLSLAADHDPDAWSVTTPWFRSSAVVAPTGEVY